jgi:hypothetical protein
MNEPSQEFYAKRDGIFRLIQFAEKALIVLLAIGTILNYSNISLGRSLMLVTLCGLAIVWLALSFRPVDIFSSQQDADEFGRLSFGEMIGLVFVSKIIGIGTAISAFGLFSFVADFGNNGYLSLLFNGGLAILICLIVLSVAHLSGARRLKLIFPILLRALIIFLFDFYIFLMIDPLNPM